MIGKLHDLYMAKFVYGIDAKKLWRRYMLGLSLILTLLFGTHMVAVWVIAETDGDAVVINDSGRQRMLSQRILYFATALVAENDPSARGPLQDAVDLFERSHARLAGQDALSDAMRTLYFAPGAEPSLDALVARFVANARTVLAADGPAQSAENALAAMRTVGPGMLLRKLNDAVTLYEREARARTSRINRLQDVGLMLAAITLMLEALLIFLPAQLAARRALVRLEGQADALDDARRSESAKNVELEALRSAAEHDALHDPLTGLANRRYLERELPRLAESCRRSHDGLAVFHIDLDRFKQINDTLGHAAGDYILRYVADVLRETAHETDFVARVGGDEFVIVRRSNETRRPLEATGDDIIARLSEPVNFEGDLCRFGASVGIDIGIAAASGPSIDTDRLLANADIALYRSKELGRGRVTFFCEALRQEVEVGKALADEIALAIPRGELFIVYQPQISARDGALHGLEALVRWRHPERGVLGPGEFLPIAERLGLAAAVDEHVFALALADLQRWDSIGAVVPRLSVNVSARRLSDKTLAQSLARMAIPRDRISFEILESVFVDVVDDTMRRNLEALRELGVELEIDDFGTGHASIVAILALNPRRLKIARELIQPIASSTAHKGMVTAILETARALELEVIAEGIESAAEDRILTGLGCDVLQGFRFARPMPFDELTARLVHNEDWRSQEEPAAMAASG